MRQRGVGAIGKLFSENFKRRVTPTKACPLRKLAAIAKICGKRRYAFSWMPGREEVSFELNDGEDVG